MSVDDLKRRIGLPVLRDRGASAEGEPPEEFVPCLHCGGQASTNSQTDGAFCHNCGEWGPKAWARFEGQHHAHRKLELLLSKAKGVDLQLGQTYAYIEVYDRVQHYGGPEEGGWYYHSLTPQGVCVPFVAVNIASGDEADEFPRHVDNEPHGVEYVLVRTSELVDDPREDDGSWRLIAFLTSDAVRVTDALVDLGFENHTDRYGQGQQVLISGAPGQHTTRRRPRYE